ncbi:MAG: FAD-dependent oxidoreductase [Bradymonadaceae bacterium]
MSAKNRKKNTDVVIIGGGLAGLTAAVGLVNAGLDVTVIEQDKRLGGRAQSWVDPTTGDEIHIGPHIFLSAYPNMFKFLDELGTRDRIVWQKDHFITLADGPNKMIMHQAPLPAPLHFLPAMFTDERMTTADKLSGFPVTLYAMQMTEEDVLRLDGMNAYAFLRRMGVSKRLIDDFWSFACMSIMNVPIELCSAGALMRFYQRFIGKSNFCFGFPDGGLGDLFAPQARALIEAKGSRVLLNTTVDSFLGDDQNVTGVQLKNGKTIEARYTICALPPQALRRISKPAWRDEHETFANLVHFHPSPYVSSYIWFDRKITDMKMWARVHTPNDLNCDFYDLSNINRGWEDKPSVITSNIIFCNRADGMSDEEIFEATLRELSEFLPQARPENVTHWVVNRIPMAIHCPYPGTERRRPRVKTPVENLWLAGDWIRTGLPSSMESACASGWLAAQEILEHTGRPEKLVVEHDRVEGLSRLVHHAGQLSPLRPARRFMRRLLGETQTTPTPKHLEAPCVR